MTNRVPKYSIIIPARNGGKYLPACVNTIIGQEYTDYELIISDDHSDDGSKEYLSSLSHPNVRVFEPPKSLSMTEHWEWALSQASGEWLIFVGQDDGLQSYFFQLSDILTEIASSKGIRTIMSQRAYFFWKGCEFIYGDVAVQYNAVSKVKILDWKIESLKALLAIQSYFELPEMYTTSLFRRGLIEETKGKQNGKVFTTHPQDANLAAIACSLEKKYLKSYVPLGWIGSSPKSAGMAISSEGAEGADATDRLTLNSLKVEYEEKISKSDLQYHYLAGSFALGSIPVYFWQALLQTMSLRSPQINRILLSKLFKLILFSCAHLELTKSTKPSSTHKSMVEELLMRNHCNYQLVRVLSIGFRILFKMGSMCLIPYRLFRKSYRVLKKKHIKVTLRWSDNPEANLSNACKMAHQMLAEFGQFENIFK
jgi:glycosyltransferase involved in cell wall biosynthesis